MLSVLATAALLVLLLTSGASAAMRDLAMWVTGAAAGDVRTTAIYAVLLTAIEELLAMPLAFYSGFVLERRYRLSSERLRTWLGDHAKAVAVGGVLALAAIVTVYAAIALSPRYWWAASALAFMAATAMLARLTPVLLLPLFYKFTPLARESLRARLVALSERAGVPVLGVYEWGLGEKTRRANAALVGTGATRRILVSDTLLAHYSDDEIEVILAHELAHHVHRDIPKALLVEFGFLMAALAVGAVALDRGWQALGFAGPHDVAGVPLLLLSGGGIMLVFTPLSHALSRWNERRADRYALEMTKQPEAFVSAMRRLAAQNLAESNPSRATLWLFYTHPPIEQRIAAAREAGGSQ